MENYKGCIRKKWHWPKNYTTIKNLQLGENDQLINRKKLPEYWLDWKKIVDFYYWQISVPVSYFSTFWLTKNSKILAWYFLWFFFCKIQLIKINFYRPLPKILTKFVIVLKKISCTRALEPLNIKVAFSYIRGGFFVENLMLDYVFDNFDMRTRFLILYFSFSRRGGILQLFWLQPYSLRNLCGVFQSDAC